MDLATSYAFSSKWVAMQNVSKENESNSPKTTYLFFMQALKINMGIHKC